MLAGNVRDYEKFLPYIPEGLQKALRYLAETDFSRLADGKYEIDGDRVFARVSHYSTAPRAEKKPEAHNDYIDVQFLAQGSERIYYTPRSGNYTVAEDRAREKDLLLYQPLDEENSVVLGHGTFAVFAPFEIHRPGCMARETPVYVQKIVVKVKAL